MAYDKGFLNKRITILNRKGVTTEHGAKKGESYEPDGAPIFANVDFLKGKKALMEASLDALSSYIVRTAWHDRLTDKSRILWKGKVYQIDPPRGDREKDEMQFTMYEQA
ncbi:MAG: head-tail adaptor protein [Bacteroidaceae bacterium]|nr:head-tail adaptor protein [Bacteroidaceae bacterium]